ncbi:MAG: hypothetical protein IPL35_17295 [Sphingobacteriales bacterium]|nr:hypothetical protein [Sphingobacteriales bacterium]
MQIQRPLTVTVNAPVTPTFSPIAAICSGGSFTLPSSSTNSPAIPGSWSPAVNTTATTTYTFTPAAGQCANTATLTVTVNAPVTPTFSPIAAICSGGSFTLPSSSTNSPAIPGTWSPAVNNTATTTYTFTPAAGQCANTATLTVTVNAPVTPTFSPIAAICSGGSFTLPSSSTNSPPIPGGWTPAVNTTATTTYTFTPCCGAMCKYSNLDGDGECPCDSYIQSDSGDLFGRLLHFAIKFNEQSTDTGYLESCGEHYSYNDLHLYPECGTMCEYGNLDGDGECPCDPYIQSDSGNLFGRLLYLAV